MAKIKIGIIGLGTVGSGVYKSLQEFNDVEIVKIAVRNINKPRAIDVPKEMLTDDPLEIVNNPNIDVVVELMGGVEPAWSYIETALKNKKHIVTANKELLAKKGEELFNLSEEKQNALNEVRILASVKSPFVISYKEAFIEEEETLCIVMEYADRGDLYQKIVRLKKDGHLIDDIDAWKIFIQMTRGLKSLHDLKILHRDLKSANIFLFSDGTAKIGDLNVSKVARRGLGYTQTGTPYYASPEVWDEKPYDNKSDIWSLGCVTYEMLTLHPPFRAKDMEQLYNAVIKGQYRKIGDKFSDDMREIIDYLLKVNPKDRPNCDEILKHPIVKKRLEFFQAQAGENED